MQSTYLVSGQEYQTIPFSLFFLTDTNPIFFLGNPSCGCATLPQGIVFCTQHRNYCYLLLLPLLNTFRVSKGVISKKTMTEKQIQTPKVAAFITVFLSVGAWLIKSTASHHCVLHMYNCICWCAGFRLNICEGLHSPLQ